jgi:hypothetical protein
LTTWIPRGVELPDFIDTRERLADALRNQIEVTGQSVYAIAKGTNPVTGNPSFSP